MAQLQQVCYVEIVRDSNYSAIQSTQVRKRARSHSLLETRIDISPSVSSCVAASRIESGGYRGRIHLSEQTASELKKHGKEGWIIPREDMIDAKGKGSLQTYWLKNKLDKSKHVGADKSESSESEGSERQTASSESDTSNVDLNGANRASVDFQAHNNTKREDRIQRLVLWNSELLQNALKQIVTHRNAATCTSSSSGITVLQADVEIEAQKIGTGTIVADEVAEIIEMPPYVHISATSEVQLTVIVVEQLSSYVSKVASMYNDNPCKFM